VQDLAARPVRGAGAIRVEDEAPTPPVNAHVVMELASQHAVAERGLAAVGLVAQMVNIAVGGWLAAGGDNGGGEGELRRNFISTPW
jgi:hypothetical protein